MGKPVEYILEFLLYLKVDIYVSKRIVFVRLIKFWCFKMSTKTFQGDVSSKMGHFMFGSYMDMTEQFLCFSSPYSVIF